jgi:hypothetical protein
MDISRDRHRDFASYACHSARLSPDRNRIPSHRAPLEACISPITDNPGQQGNAAGALAAFDCWQDREAAASMVVIHCRYLALGAYDFAFLFGNPVFCQVAQRAGCGEGCIST